MAISELMEKVATGLIPTINMFIVATYGQLEKQKLVRAPFSLQNFSN